MVCSLIYVDHQQNSSSLMIVRMLKNLLLCKCMGYGKKWYGITNIQRLCKWIRKLSCHMLAITVVIICFIILFFGRKIDQKFYLFQVRWK